jgi:superfamily II DNA helicase RecQ
MSGRAKRKRQVYEGEMQDAQFVRWKRLRGVDIHRELEQMLGSEARFRGLQEPVLNAIMKHQNPILGVIATGVGKTMLFQLPAKAMNLGTTIVITPLVLLQDHMVERCQQLGISCVKKAQAESQDGLLARSTVPETKILQRMGLWRGCCCCCCCLFNTP